MANILFIEPDRILAKTYCQVLTEAGHSVTLAVGAQAAIAAADKTRPDIIVLELQLVEHSGIEFLYEFRSYKDWQDTPVLIHTQVPPGEFASNMQLLREQLAVRSYLYKPHTSLRELVAQVDQHLPVQA